MPAIKLKKKTQEYLAEKEREKELERESKETPVTPADEKKKKAPAQGQKRKFTEVNRLDGEVLLEKRKRTIPVVELKCSDW